MENLIQWMNQRGYEVHNRDLYKEACTHSSYANENHSNLSLSSDTE